MIDQTKFEKPEKLFDWQAKEVQRLRQACEKELKELSIACDKGRAVCESMRLELELVVSYRLVVLVSRLVFSLNLCSRSQGTT